MKLTIFVIVTLFFLAEPISGKVFNKCSLAKELKRLGVPRSELADFVCIAQYESSFDTKTVKLNANRTRNWGLFQLKDKYWCKPSNGDRSHNVCKLSCDSLLTDDITSSVQCAVLVKNQQGFNAWFTWQNECKGKTLSVNECF